jgi:hypothetical protein
LSYCYGVFPLQAMDEIFLLSLIGHDVKKLSK